MSDIVTYPDPEKTKRKRGEYATDWGLVREHLGVYGITVVLYMLVIMVISHILLSTLSFRSASFDSVFWTFPMGIVSVVIVFLGSGMIHLIVTRMLGGKAAFHDFISEGRQFLTCLTILFWLSVLLYIGFYRSPVSFLDFLTNVIGVIVVGFLLMMPFMAIHLIKRVYGTGIIKSIVVLVSTTVMITISVSLTYIISILSIVTVIVVFIQITSGGKPS